ncbi:MAG: GntP family permease, partial [Bacteroidetes bacterium]|nr:GntP family permease [Bacteroidota bacterium]
FIILSGLAKSVSAKSKIAMPFIAIVLACSLYSVHCLIPPHPGALAAAGIMKANIGVLIVIGTLFAIPGFIVSYYWVKWITKKKGYLPADEKDFAQQTDGNNLPPVFLSFLPIAAPLTLITANSLFSLPGFDSSSVFIKGIIFCGQPVIALSIGVLLAILLIKDKSMKGVNSIFEQAIEKAGPILIVTAAGGMFGMVIKETGIGSETGNILSRSGLGLAIPFLMAFIMKTAQGSSTVAIITVASIITPMLPVLGLDSEWGKIFTMLAMGAGSMMISHANDSYFWVITKFADIKADVTLRVYSSATIIMGITVFICVWVVSFFVL